jgi:branched-chain amino acid aminotransferase
MDDNIVPARAKATGIYINTFLAKSDAARNGFDEAIFLDRSGHVCEGSAENIFIYRFGKLHTPPVYNNILEGITRQSVIELAQKELGIACDERPIDRSELYIADEVFLCGTGAQISPVVDVDRRRIGDGNPGALTRRLQALYFAIVRGQNPAYSQWLTKVSPA